MKHLIPLFILLILIGSCFNPKENHQVIVPKTNKIVVGKKPIVSKGIAKESKRKAFEYFVILNKDTSRFNPSFIQLKDGDEFYINFPNSKQSNSYTERLEEFSLILNEASHMYLIDSLKRINTGLFNSSGDLAIAITNEFMGVFSHRIQQPKGPFSEVSTALYKDISSFLLTSTMVKDLNTILKPYAIAIDKIRLEKVHFVSKDRMLINRGILEESNQIPNHILRFSSQLYINKIDE